MYSNPADTMYCMSVDRSDVVDFYVHLYPITVSSRFAFEPTVQTLVRCSVLKVFFIGPDVGGTFDYVWQSCLLRSTVM